MSGWSCLSQPCTYSTTHVLHHSHRVHVTILIVLLYISLLNAKFRLFHLQNLGIEMVILFMNLEQQSWNWIFFPEAISHFDCSYFNAVSICLRRWRDYSGMFWSLPNQTSFLKRLLSYLQNCVGCRVKVRNEISWARGQREDLRLGFYN